MGRAAVFSGKPEQQRDKGSVLLLGRHTCLGGHEKGNGIYSFIAKALLFSEKCQQKRYKESVFVSGGPPGLVENTEREQTCVFLLRPHPSFFCEAHKQRKRDPRVYLGRLPLVESHNGISCSAPLLCVESRAESKGICGFVGNVPAVSGKPSKNIGVCVLCFFLGEDIRL